jgi:Holliday junction resolvasome RuvABC endonuclease subunit
MKRILALDLASNTGWAVQRRDGKVETGVYVCLRTAIAGRRWVRFRDWLKQTIDFEDHELVIFEEPFIHMKHVSGIGISYGFKTVVELLAAQHEITCCSISATALKKWATGRGNADKSVMLTYARSMGWNLSDDNEVDARFLLHFASERAARAQKAIAQSGTGAGL